MRGFLGGFFSGGLVVLCGGGGGLWYFSGFFGKNQGLFGRFTILLGVWGAFPGFLFERNGRFLLVHGGFFGT